MPHIKIELDFIPVEERLPEKSSAVYALSDGYRVPQKLWYREAGEWCWFVTGNPFPARVTHWAEILEIE